MSSQPRKNPRRRYIPAVPARLSPLLFLYVLAALSVSAGSAPCAAQESSDDWLGPDKPVHALATAWTAGVTYAVGVRLDWDPADRRRAALGSAAAVALAKEAFDRWTQGERFSFKDLAAGAVGVGAFLAVSAAADR